MQERIVFVGDSITDGNTYPLLVRQALADAGKPVPICINAGVAGDTAAGVRKRLDRDVFVHKPTRITLSIGINDVLRKVSTKDYRTDVQAVVDRCRQEKVPLLILTTTILGPKHADAEKRLVEFNAALRSIVEKSGCAIAEVNDPMQQARKGGEVLLEPDEVHLSFAGYRVMARAVLDGLGHKDSAVPKDLKLQLLPGVISEWKMRAVHDKQPLLDEAAVQKLQPDEAWKTYRLPEKDPLPHWWQDQERQRGFAQSLEKLVDPGKRWEGVAYMEAEKPRTVYFNTGAQLQSVWLNGKRIFQVQGWTGWHAGKERVEAELKAGKNVIVIETGSAFFLGVTEDREW